MKRNVLRYGIGVLALLSMSACNREDITSGFSSAGQQTVLVAQKSHIITRAGDEVTQFKPGTKYLLYAVNQENAEVLNGEGTERDNHTIDYGNVISYSSSPISFYGATYGSTTEVPTFSTNDEDETDETSITETVREENGILPDLMFSNNLKDQTVSNGYRLEMNFKHAMSKLKFRIVKQDETEDDEKKLENATLTKIQVKGTHKAGTLDIVNGKWTYAEEEVDLPVRTYYTNATGMKIETASQEVPGEMLVFPNEANEQVTISVTLTGIGDNEDEKTEEYHLMKINEEGEEDGNFFQFEMNHEYTLLITVLKDEVRTIAIAPQVYEWIDEDRDNYLGQPVTFANLMWMDRNLGAKSADCENDWENCRGYYYQYARNIPYILDKEMYDAAANQIPVYPFLYTYNQYGEKVYGGVQAGTTVDGVPVRYPNIAINPGDEGVYQFVWDTGNSGIWLFNEIGNAEYEQIDMYWTSDNNNHPCPKGWRLPTRADFASFLPEKNYNGTWYTGFHYDCYDTDYNYIEDKVHGTINGERAMYLIKRKGRSDCYRIRILLKDVTTSPEKRYFEFAYFSGDETMSFEGVLNEDDFNKLNMDWNTPTAIMQVPACGFIYTSGGDKLHEDGTSTILRSTDWVRAGYNWVCYLRGDTNFGLFSGSRKALGDQIRCVRDVTAK